MIILVLSVFVSADVFLALRETGITMAGNASCGILEHSHDDSCYKNVLDCENSNKEHEHTDLCFNKVLICSKKEHIHNVSCYSDDTADVESKLDWQEMFYDFDYKKDFKTNLVGIAKTQIGYKESASNFTADSEGNRYGYTRYGAWYGMPYSDWSAMFVAFCLHYAGSNTNQTPFNLGAETMRIEWDKKEIYTASDFSKAQMGDVLFVDENNDGLADRVGIITQTTDLYINTVEGDVYNSVAECTYRKDDITLLGYGVTPTEIKSVVESPIYLSASSSLTQNTIKDAFITDSKYSGMYNAESPLGTAGSFHIVAFDTAYLKVHTNGNVLAKNVQANSNFGTNSKEGVDLIELSYIQNYLSVNSGSGADTSDYLVLGTNNTITLVDNGNAVAVNGTKLDKPKKSNIIIDSDTSTAPFIDLVRVENEIKSIASQLASYKNSDSSILEVNTSGTSPYLKITNKDNTGIYTFTAQEIVNLSKIGNGIDMKGFETGGNGAIIVNVDCKDWDESQTLTMPRAYVYVDGKQVNLTETLDFSAGKVIWNFINTARTSGTLLKIQTNLMTGAVVAPDAHINLALSYNGTAIGRVVENNSETHRTDYTGKIVPTGEVGGAYIDVHKVDENDSEIKLSGAEYTLYEWNGSNWQISIQNNENVIKTTNTDGIAYFKGLTYNVAYMLKETKAPNGYVLDETPFYFYFESANTTKYPKKMPNGFENTSEKNCFTHTFTNKCVESNKYAPLNINKNWLNASGNTEIPEGVKSANFELWRVSRSDTSSAWTNPELIYDNIIVSANNSWSWQAGANELLASKTVGTKTTYYAYYVVETSSVEGYTPSYNGITQSAPQAGAADWNINVTNYKVETTSIDITKEWYNADGSVMTEPPVVSISVQIYVSEDNGNTWNKYGNALSVTQENNWQLTVSNLPVKNPETNASYIYQVREFEIDNFKSEIETSSNGDVTIKNTCESEFTSIKVDKKWVRNGKYINKTTGSIGVELYQIAGFDGGISTTTDDNTVAVTVQIGKYYYGNVEYKDQVYYVPIGTKMTIVYDFVPVGEGYYLNEVKDGVTTALIPVSKVENGASANNYTGYNVTYEYIVTGPTSLQGILSTWTEYAHKVSVTYEEPAKMTTTLYKTATISADNDWTYTFGNLPKYIPDSSGKPTDAQYYYYVVEVNAKDYSPVYKDSSGKNINEENPVTNGSIIIENTVTQDGYELPGTGGKGFIACILLGMLLIISAAMCLVYINKRGKGAKK